MMIRFAQETDRAAIEVLWELCFPDDTGFNRFYFDHLFSLPDTLLCIEDGLLAAMVQMLPYTVRLDGKAVPATYIYGACTHPEFRRRHLMRALLEESFRLDQKNGRPVSMLIPQEEWLFEFYRPFGYSPSFDLCSAQRTVTGAAHPGFRALADADVPTLQRLYTQVTAQTNPAVQRTDAQWRDQIALFQALGCGAFGLMDADGTLCAYAFVWQESDGLWAQELMYGHIRARDQLLAALAHHARCSAIRISGLEGEGKPLGCLRYAEGGLRERHGYMNLMLN